MLTMLLVSIKEGRAGVREFLCERCPFACAFLANLSARTGFLVIRSIQSKDIHEHSWREPWGPKIQSSEAG